MTLLDNPLVKKYFGCDVSPGVGPHSCAKEEALRVLEAMETPIKAGDRYLWLDDGKVEELTNRQEFLDNYLHPRALRLPDRFQKANKGECVKCRGAEAKLCKACADGEGKTITPDTLDEKLRKIAADFVAARERRMERLADELREEAMRDARHLGYLAGQESMREACARVAERRNDNGMHPPIELRAFDMHVARKACANLIAEDIRALTIEKEPRS